MRATAAGALVVLLVFTGCGPGSAPKPTLPDLPVIVVGIVNDAPGFSVGDTNPAGFDINLMNAIGAKLGKPVAPTPLTSRDREGYLKDKKATIVIATFSITTDRNDRGIDFAGPYMVSPQALIVRANDTRMATKGDMANKSVCTVKTTTGSGVVIPGANMDTKLLTTKDCIDLLARGGTDAVFTDALILYGYTRANPGTFKVVLSGAFGELQYYGVGLLADHKADCLELNKVITEYLRTQWRHDFLDTLQDAVAAHRGDNTSGGDFESQFKPKGTDMISLSCKL